ncbi:uncharacterized protein TNCV_4278831 [Trichonephila clavipes]|nr:uncharacterized protein TNCV_4278831 [Trichonephila clavipes]
MVGNKQPALSSHRFRIAMPLRHHGLGADLIKSVEDQNLHVDVVWKFKKRGASSAVAEWSRYRIETGLVTSSSPVPLKARRVGVRCTLNLSRDQTSSRWCGVVVRRGFVSSGVVHVT